MVLRIAIALAGATCMVVLIFMGMRSLVAGRDMLLDEDARRKMIEFVRVRQDSDARSKDRKLPQRQRPKPPPSTPDMDMPESDGPGAVSVAMSAPDIATNLDLTNAMKLGPAPADNEAVPVVRVEPIYPRRAAEQFIEGWVEIQFDIGPTGSTRNVRVRKSNPRGIFDKAAVQAVKKWKYKAKILDGKAQTTRGQVVRLTFDLDG